MNANVNIPSKSVLVFDTVGYNGIDGICLKGLKLSVLTIIKSLEFNQKKLLTSHFTFLMAGFLKLLEVLEGHCPAEFSSNPDLQDRV